MENEIASYIEGSSKKRKRQLEKMTAEQLNVELVKSKIRACCETLDVSNAVKIYEYITQNNIILNKNTYMNLLSLTAGFGDIGSGSTQFRPEIVPFDLNTASIIFKDMKRFEIPLDESSYTAIIRCFSLHGKHDEALTLYHEMQEAEIIPKNRTFTPLLTIFSKLEQDDICLDLFFNDILQRYKLIPTEKDYISMLHLAFMLKDNELFERIYDFLQEDIYVPSAQTTELIINIVQLFNLNCKVYQCVPNESGMLYIDESIIKTLVSIEITDAQRELMMEEITKYAYTVKESRIGPEDKTMEGTWREYNRWLTDHFSWSRDARREAILVDGANVGYFENNYEGAPAHVDYEKIDWMMEELYNLGYYPLVILHERHLGRHVPDKYKSIVSSWMQSGRVFSTPRSCNDDWFWMFGAGYLRCKLVTNDEMRDHHFKVLSGRWFHQWKERKQVKFLFGKFEPRILPPDWEHRIAKPTRKVRRTVLSFPLIYSHRMQRDTAGAYFIPLQAQLNGPAFAAFRSEARHV